jgi:signal transduction histidine kinase
MHSSTIDATAFVDPVTASGSGPMASVAPGQRGGNVLDPKLVAAYRRFAPVGAVGVIFIALVVMLGWLADVPILTSAGPTWVRMKFNAAIPFLVLGITVLLFVTEAPLSARWRVLVQLGIAFAMAIGVASLLEDVLGVSLGFDQLLTTEVAHTRETIHPGRIAPLTSVSLILTSLALLVANARSSTVAWLLPSCCVASCIIAMSVLLGYFLGVRELYTLAGHTTAVGFPSAVAILLLSIAILCANSDHMLFRRMASAGSGGYMLRRLLPISAAVVVFVETLRLWGQDAGLFSTVEFGAAVVAASIIIAMGFIVTWCAAKLDKSDAARVMAEAKVRQLNSQLHQRLTDLEAANKELEAFSYSVSHDLRTPLRAIDGFSRILSEDYADKLDAEAQRIIGVVRDGTLKMAHLIDDILAFSRIGRAEMTTTLVDMNELVQDVLHDLAPAMAGRQLRFAIADLPPARGDKMMLRRVWQNLLDNAVKYTGTHDCAAIEVGVEPAVSELVYFVRDDGVGFDKRYVDKLFGVFRRLHGPNEFSGTGIGLAIIKRIITRHGGRVWAEGELGKGAIFHFTLPVRETPDG